MKKSLKKKLNVKMNMNLNLKMSVGRKIFTIFASIIVVILILSAVNMTNMNRMKNNSTEVSEQLLPSVMHISEMRYLMEALVSKELSYVNSTNDSNKSEYLLSMESILEKYQKASKSYESLELNSEEKELYNEVKKGWTDYLAIHEEVITEGKANNVEKAEEILRKGSWDLSSISINMNKLVEISEKSADAVSKEGHDLYNRSNVVSIIFIAAAILLSAFLGLLLTRNISVPIRKMADQVKQVASGNLVIEEIKIKNKDELGSLARDFNDMTRSLRSLITSVSEHSEQVAATSEQLTASAEQSTKASEHISEAIQEVANGSESQMNQANETNKAVDEISKGMNQAATSIQVVAELSTGANEQATAGNKVVGETIDQMNTVQNQVKATANVVNSLGEKSNKISSIVTLITEVADQTNLLALNAAIEAARAGEHGRGFAVVADEVRKLAEQSSKAANEISTIIVEIKNEADHAVVSMKNGSLAVDVGIVKVEETGNAFKGIAKLIEEVAEHSHDVSAVVEEVSASSDSMVMMINEVASLSEQAAGNTQNVAASAEEQSASMEEISSSATALSKMASELQEIVSRFKV